MFSKRSRSNLSKIVSSTKMRQLPQLPLIRIEFGDLQEIQRELLTSNLIALKYFESLLKFAIEIGCSELVESSSRAIARHSSEVAKHSGLSYYADINAAVGLLEKEGYLITEGESELP